jgi:hypothetical protein
VLRLVLLPSNNPEFDDDGDSALEKSKASDCTRAMAWVLAQDPTPSHLIQGRRRDTAGRPGVSPRPFVNDTVGWVLGMGDIPWCRFQNTRWFRSCALVCGSNDVGDCLRRGSRFGTGGILREVGRVPSHRRRRLVSTSDRISNRSPVAASLAPISRRASRRLSSHSRPQASFGYRRDLTLRSECCSALEGASFTA